jgi:LysM repeat protein
MRLDRGIEICPLLLSRDGTWVSAVPSKELRCWAVAPPAQPAAQKQRQLCLVGSHVSCATFRAAIAEEPGLHRREGEGAGLWPDAAGVPVALEAVHARPGVSVSSPKAGGQALLVGLMVVAFLVLVIARTNPLASGAPSPSASPVASAVASAAAPSVAPSPSPAASPDASPTPALASATPAPSATPVPSASQRTYKVKSGDTIASIAAKFNTTVKAIVKANNITDPRTIHVGQVLVIP